MEDVKKMLSTEASDKQTRKKEPETQRVGSTEDYRRIEDQVNGLSNADFSKSNLLSG